MKRRTLWLAGVLLFAAAFCGQWWFTQAFAVPVSADPDGAVYLRLAHNLFAHGAYSIDAQPPLAPILLRMPGYPLLLAGLFTLGGDGNDDAVRLFQVLLTTLTCTLAAALAHQWHPDPSRRPRAALIAFVLAALCPFTAIYAGGILTESLTLFLTMLLMLAATWAFHSRLRPSFEQAWRWAVAGLVAGALQSVRPEAGLFAAAVGFTLLGSGFPWLAAGTGGAEERGGAAAGDRPVAGRGAIFTARWSVVVRNGAIFSCAFALTLVPWTLRNARAFHIFQPLVPASGALPGEPDDTGFRAWYGTWADSERTLEPIYWGMTDRLPASLDDLPPAACDNDDERARTAALFEQCNAPAPPDAEPPPLTRLALTPADDPPPPLCAGITPAVDAAFARLARERIAHSPWRCRVVLPLRRAVNLWFVPHAQYFPFDGSLIPMSESNDHPERRLWLPVFFALTCAYSALGLAGMWRLARTRGPGRADAWRWAVLVVLAVVPRWTYLSTLEHTEPRYLVEVFPFLCVLGGIALSGPWKGRPAKTAVVFANA